ncbi:MAG: hypothetical protein Q9191_003234 [Dirinaria sp. TL-2023a]
MSLIQRLQQLASRQPDEVLYEWFERRSDGDVIIKHSYSYRQAWDRVSVLAHHLIHNENVKPRDRILLCYPPCLDFLFAFLACILANVIPVPAYPPNPQNLQATIPTFTRIKILANARIVLTNTQYNRWTALNLFVKWPSDLKWVCTDPIFKAHRDLPSDYEWQQADLSNTAFLQFTSGSTGNPKGVMISHRALWASFRAMTVCEEYRTSPKHSNEELAITQSSPQFKVVSWLPLYHDFGLIFAALLPIYRAGTAILCSPLDFIAQPLSWLRALSKFRATATCAPNFAFDLVVRRWQNTVSHQRPKIDLSSMRFVPCGGEIIRAKTMTDFRDTFKPCGFNGQSLCLSYGFAECTVAACAEYSNNLVHSKTNPALLSCGSNFHRGGLLVAIIKQWQGISDHPELHAVRPEVAEDGEIGQIIVTGNPLSSGYWPVGDTPERDPQIFIPKAELPSAVREMANCHPEIDSDFWFATGDLGLLEEGHLYITGRIKEVIVIRGRNYMASDIEHTVSTSTPEVRPGCIAAVAVSGPESSTENALILCEVRSLSADQEAKNAIENIRCCIRGSHGINVSIALLEKGALPKTSSGKLQRLKAAEMWTAGSFKHVAFDPISQQSPLSDSKVAEVPQGSANPSLESTGPSQVPNLEPEAMASDSECLAWDYTATYQDRFSALYAQIHRIISNHLASLEEEEEADDRGNLVDINTEWRQLGLDSLGAVLIMQELQDEANKFLKTFSTPIILSPNLLFEHQNVKALIVHLISLQSVENEKVSEGPEVANKTPKMQAKPQEQENQRVDFEHAFELPQSTPPSGYLFFAAAQAIWTCCMWSAIVYAASFALFFVNAKDWIVITILIPVVHFCFLLSLALATIVLKKSIIGAYQPGCQPQYGSYHLRYWMVESAVNVTGILGLNALHNTKAYETYLELLGVNLSPGASINTSINTAFDLLTVGPDAMIERNATIVCHSYQSGCLFQNRVDIGQLAIVEQRAVIQSSATVWNTTETSRQPGPATHAIPPSPYVQGDHTVLRHGSREPVPIQHDGVSAPSSLRTAAEVPLLRWAYCIGLFWLTDAAVLLAALASIKITGFIKARSGDRVPVLDLGYDQVVYRNYAFTFAFGPHIIFPNIFLLSQGAVWGLSEDLLNRNSMVFEKYKQSSSSVKGFSQILLTLVVMYLAWATAMAAITLAVRHLFVPPLRDGDILKQHSYSAATRQLYSNLVRRLHSLTFFLTTGKPQFSL